CDTAGHGRNLGKRLESRVEELALLDGQAANRRACACRTSTHSWIRLRHERRRPKKGESKRAHQNHSRFLMFHCRYLLPRDVRRLAGCRAQPDDAGELWKLSESWNR